MVMKISVRAIVGRISNSSYGQEYRKGANVRILAEEEVDGICKCFLRKVRRRIRESGFRAKVQLI